ncbi:gamma-butyrobetaine hydroxylase-like domain-containing protein [Gilvimarinus polysaccharolyticus]|uniref:gamma-butyrobetaine hydroxylase-like domain-containing protein n=1 Tax=Gilvimarinus polysaccharolyticus TaxID=863921 RepID=UPI0006736D44|nr:DUF971 domain-containing protein [Gilvimarinus polysaccharolyticus]
MSKAPDRITLHRKSAELELQFGADHYRLTAEFLRVHSPSAEVKGHGPGQAVLQTGKQEVNIKRIEAVGNYAIKLVFDDGHDTGIYTWEQLHEFCQNREHFWQSYLDAIQSAGASRLPDDIQVIKLM